MDPRVTRGVGLALIIGACVGVSVDVMPFLLPAATASAAVFSRWLGLLWIVAVASCAVALAIGTHSRFARWLFLYAAALKFVQAGYTAAVLVTQPAVLRTWAAFYLSDTLSAVAAILIFFALLDLGVVPRWVPWTAVFLQVLTFSMYWLSSVRRLAATGVPPELARRLVPFAPEALLVVLLAGFGLWIVAGSCLLQSNDSDRALDTAIA